jgi:hypothetical protein
VFLENSSRYSIVCDTKARHYAHVRVKKGSNWEKITVTDQRPSGSALNLNLNDRKIIKEAIELMFIGPHR